MTFAAITDVRVPLIPVGASAEIPCSVLEVDAVAVDADAGGCPPVVPPLGILARLVAHHPVQHHRQLLLPAHELAGGGVGPPEHERRLLDHHGVATRADAGDAGGIEVGEVHFEGSDAPRRDGNLAAATGAGAGPVGQRPRARLPGTR